MMRSPGMGGERMIGAAARAITGRPRNAARPGGRSQTRSGGSRLVRLPSPPPPLPPASSSAVPGLAFSGGTGALASMPFLCEEDDWEDVGAEEFETERFVFGRQPSREEVEEAVSGLQQIYVPVAFGDMTENANSYYLENFETVDMESSLRGVTRTLSALSTSSNVDWIEPSVQVYINDNVQMARHHSVHDAFRLLQVNPAIQRMVLSLSSDKAVWDAVMSNEVVQEIKKSFEEDALKEADSGKEQSKGASGVLHWIMSNTQAKLGEFFDNLMKVVNDLFKFENSPEAPEFYNAVRSSLMLSVVVFLVVVATRLRSA